MNKLVLALGLWMTTITAAQMTAPQWDQTKVVHGPTMPPGPDEPIR
jgi:hypothetical protein